MQILTVWCGVRMDSVSPKQKEVIASMGESFQHIGLTFSPIQDSGEDGVIGYGVIVYSRDEKFDYELIDSKITEVLPMVADAFKKWKLPEPRPLILEYGIMAVPSKES